MRVTGEGRHQHHQRALGQVEVGQQQIHHLEGKARRDEDARLVCKSVKPPVLARRAFERAQRGGADRYNAPAAVMHGV